MLVLTRRPGESVLIGENIEVMIVDVDCMDLATRCAISVCDEDGNDLPLQHAKTQAGVTIVRQR
jgi:Global regulator protein family